MRRVLVLAVLPIVLFALEKVNLIKDGGFEKNSEVWLECAGGDKGGDSAVANRHSSEKSFSGEYSAFSDTREMPPNPSLLYEDTALVIQGFTMPKPVSDLDSLTLEYSVIPCREDTASLMSGFVAFYLNAGQEPYWLAGYCIRLKGHGAFLDPPRKLLKAVDFPGDELWYKLTFEAGKDLDDSGFSGFKVDSFFLMGWGCYFSPWRGQKIYWDDIRLTGYADYDVGVKGFVSKDSVWKDTGYTPTARIKNFGRKPADSFLVIATIEGGAGVVYADTLSWSLPADTEDTVSFKEFKPSDAANYTLTVSTVMTPDESDEDDALSRTLFGTAVAEPVLSPQSLSLQIEGVLRVSYSLPLGEHGTISLYDPAGRRVESLRVQGEGSVSLKSGLATGVYFIRLETSHSSAVRKAVVLD